MFNSIPYYRDGKIKNICIDSSGYIVTRYSNEKEVYLVKMTLSDNNTEILKREYYSTLKEYLDTKDLDYRLSKHKIDGVINVKISKIILILSASSFIIPALGVYYANVPLLLFGVLTTIGAGVGFTTSYENIKKNKINNINKSFCDNYDQLKNIYNNYLSLQKPKTNVTQQKIKSIAHDVRGLPKTKSRKK